MTTHKYASPSTLLQFTELIMERGKELADAGQPATLGDRVYYLYYNQRGLFKLVYLTNLNWTGHFNEIISPTN